MSFVCSSQIDISEDCHPPNPLWAFRKEFLGTEKRKDDEVFKVYRREYKKRFGWIKAGKIEKYAFYAWSKKAREEKTKCDAGGSSLQEFTKWLKES